MKSRRFYLPMYLIYYINSLDTCIKRQNTTYNKSHFNRLFNCEEIELIKPVICAVVCKE